MSRRDLGPALLVAAVVWTTAAEGGTRPVDLALVAVLLLTALVLAAPLPTVGAVRPVVSATAVLLVVLELWLLLAGTRGAALDLATLRVPVLVVISVLTVVVAARLNGRQREVVLDSLVLVGIVQACVTIAQVVAAPSGGFLPRPTALLGNANVLGALLASTGAVTLRATARHATLRPAPLGPATLLRAALGVQACALLLTQSRLALAAAAAVLVVCRPVRLGRWALAVVAGWLLVALAVVAARFAVTGADRLPLWTAALHQLALRPLTGRGAEPVTLEVPPSGIGPTTHAHNEVLQLGVEYGVIGVGLLVAVLVLALRSRLRPLSWDRCLLGAAVPLLATGLVDIGLRVTAVVVLAALLVTLALTPAQECASTLPSR